MHVNLQKCVFSLCSCEYAHSLSACVCLVACFVIIGSATCITICYIVHGLIVLYVLMFGVFCKPT